MKKLIAIDIGATNLRIGVVTPVGLIEEVVREQTTSNNGKELYKQIKRMIKSLSYTENEIGAIGISACGLIEANIIKLLPNLHIQDFDLASMLEADFHFPVHIMNDADAAGLAEALMGNAKEFDNSYFITISSGIGGAFIYQKKLVEIPFEIGHNYISYHSTTYEIEKLASGNGLVKLCALNNIAITDARMFFKLVNDKDPKILPVYHDFIEILASMFANIQMNFKPGVIILSGGLMKSSAIFFDDLVARINVLLEPFPLPKCHFRFAFFDQDAGLIGGAAAGFSLLKE